jgi:RimJ/RimL family protein N-acetyltransferase
MQDFAITLADGGALVGGIAFTPSRVEPAAELGYWLARAWWGQGIATRAVGLLLHEVSRRPLFATVAAHNHASLRVLAKHGFVERARVWTEEDARRLAGMAARRGAGPAPVHGVGVVDPREIERLLGDITRSVVQRQEHGYWFRCPNGHSYLIGECGGAMETSRCPDCGQSVGGRGHALLGSNAREDDGLGPTMWDRMVRENPAPRPGQFDG